MKYGIMDQQGVMGAYGRKGISGAYGPFGSIGRNPLKGRKMPPGPKDPEPSHEGHQSGKAAPSGGGY